MENKVRSYLIGQLTKWFKSINGDSLYQDKTREIIGYEIFSVNDLAIAWVEQFNDEATLREIIKTLLNKR